MKFNFALLFLVGGWWHNGEMKEYSHGYLLVGDTEKAEAAAFEMASKILGKEKKFLSSHSDFVLLKSDTFGIDESRKIRDSSSKKSFSGKGRVFVISAGSLTREAANALLKTFEEPTSLSYFFLIVGSSDSVPKTLKSRLSLLRFYSSEKLDKKRIEFLNKFASATIAKRMEMGEKFLEDKKMFKDFLDDLEMFLRDRLVAGGFSDSFLVLETILKIRDFLSLRGVSLKLLLECLCCILPRA